MGPAPLATVPLPTGAVVLRRALLVDVPAIVGLLADDPLGQRREVGTDPAELAHYRAAFADIDTDLAHLLVVALADDQVVGTLQLSFLPGLSAAGRSGRRSRPSGWAARTAAGASGCERGRRRA